MFVPIDYLNEHTVNGIGVLLLRLSLAWVIVAQLLLKRAMERFSLTESKNPLPVLKAKKNYLVAVLVMFVGMMVTPTNVVAIVLCNVAFMMLRTSVGRMRNNIRQTW
ncbi:MAG TPA: hypothetical protein VM871_06045 [Flavisolibacter sp.]|jgi:hypothetical protein|nr:hypothetical protein [Flavisolibacter sp.]